MNRKDIGIRYTRGQEQLLRIKEEHLEESEREMLHKLLSPRTKFLPKTEEEAFALAEFMLGKKYQYFLEFILRLNTYYKNLLGEWVIGDKRNRMYYRMRQNGKTLCSIGICYNNVEVSISLDEKICRQFERDRNQYIRLITQWAFDVAIFKNNKKIIYLDVANPLALADIFKILSLKKKPDSQVFQYI